MKDVTTTTVIVTLSTPSGEQITLNDIEVTASELHEWPKPTSWVIVPAAITRAIRKRIDEPKWNGWSYEAGVWQISVHGQLKSPKDT